MSPPVIEKLSHSLPVAINAVAGITDYQQNRSDRLTFCLEKPKTSVSIVCDPLIR